MITSMTGFGRGESVLNNISIKIEIKTVNHRYNDINVKMPRHINYLEEYIKKELKKYISRGKVDLYIGLEYIEENNIEIKLDMPLARSYNDSLIELREELDIKGDITLNNIMTMQDIIKIDRQELDEDMVKEAIDIALDLAIKDLMSMKEAEGKNLKEDMILKLDEILSKLKVIEERSPLVLVEYREKLKVRIEEVLDNNIQIDQDRLNTEIIFFADKSNIDEEIVRLKSHINQYENILNENGAVGRKLDFLIQEMNREINTIGSKSSDFEISKEVVNIKAEIEKLREQVQNIE